MMRGMAEECRFVGIALTVPEQREGGPHTLEAPSCSCRSDEGASDTPALEFHLKAFVASKVQEQESLSMQVELLALYASEE